MLLYGLQKLTLLDFPGRVACTVFTGGCNLRCPFCHNASLVTHLGGETMESEELFSFLEKRRTVLDGVCVTGGEPLLQKDILPFLLRIRELGYAVKVDTNGTLPQALREIVEAGAVDYVAMDIKNSKEKYPQTVGLSSMPEGIEESVRYLLSGVVPFEFRTTVTEELHEPADFAAIGKWIAGAERYYLQQFTDSGDLIGEGITSPTPEKMRECLAAVQPYLPGAALRGV